MGVCSFVCWAWVCILYFFFALIFLTVLGILCHQDSFLSAVDDKKIRKKAALPAFLTVVIYAVFALISSGYLFFHAKKVKKNKAEEESNNMYTSRPRRSSAQHGQYNSTAAGGDMQQDASPVDRAADDADLARQE